jgi:hypothetical protein
MLETLVHGWDIASGAGVSYKPDDAVVTAVGEYATTAISEAPRGGRFGPVIRVAAEADAFTALLGHLGRRGCGESCANRVFVVHCSRTREREPSWLLMSIRRC